MKTNEKLFVALISTFLILLLTACGEPKSEKTASETNENTDKITLKASHPAPGEAPFAKAFEAYLKEVEERSEGRIEFDRYFGGSLAKPGDEVDALASGIADIAVFSPSYIPGKIPLATVGSNPALWGDAWVGAKAFGELYNTVPEMKEELEKNGVKSVGQWGLSSLYVLSSKKVEKIEDLKGLKVVANGQMALLAKELGANPVSLPVEDIYEALTRGTADAIFYGPVEAITFGLTDEIKYVYKLPLGSTAGLVGFNPSKFDSLPEDIKRIFEDVWSEYYPKALHEIYQVEGAGGAMKALEEAGAEIIEPTEEDSERVKEIAEEKIWSKWMDEQGQKGLPGEEVMNTLKDLVDKYNQENPYNK